MGIRPRTIVRARIHPEGIRKLAVMVQEIIDIINDKTDNGERINAIADEFRRGRDTRELLHLLRSENAEVVTLAAWILGELPEKLYSSQDFVSALHALTAHADAMVRFHAFGALYPFLDAGDPATRALLARLSQDENVGVRACAEAATARLGIVCN